MLIWGLDYSIPGPGESSYAPFWSAAYPTILSEVQQTSYPSGRPLLMVSSNFYGAWQSQYVQPILNPGYQWTTQAAQQTPSLWQQDGDTPDLYSFQMYNASAEDLEAALESAASAIPFSKMIVTEVATGSSIAGSPIGNGLAEAIDAQTPTTTAAGQAQWLTDTLCVFARHNIPAFGWYGLYDAASWYAQRDYTSSTIAQDGYWGLISEYTSYGNKPAWTAFLNYPNSRGQSSSPPPPPVLALYADASYYTQGDTGIINYTAADVSSLSLNETPSSGIFSCETSYQIAQSGSPLVGSCSSLNVTMTNQVSQISLSGVNTDVLDSQSGYQTTGSASINVTVGPSASHGAHGAGTQRSPVHSESTRSHAASPTGRGGQGRCGLSLLGRAFGKAVSASRRLQRQPRPRLRCRSPDQRVHECHNFKRHADASGQHGDDVSGVGNSVSSAADGCRSHWNAFRDCTGCPRVGCKNDPRVRHGAGERSRTGGDQVTRYGALLSLLVALSPEGRSQVQSRVAGSDNCNMRLVSAASFASGLPYGGALATAYVSGLRGLKAGTYVAPSSGPLPNSLGGVQVLVNGAVAPVLAVVVPSDPSADVQVNFQVPLERNVSLFSAFSTASSLAVEGGGVAVTLQAPQAPLPVPPRWGAFFAVANGLAAALHASDSSPVTPQHPAHPGETIVAYADDFFSTWPPPPIGIPANQPSLFQIAPRPGPTGPLETPGYLYLQTYPVPTPCPPSLNQGALRTVSATNTPAL